MKPTKPNPESTNNEISPVITMQFNSSSERPPQPTPDFYESTIASMAEEVGSVLTEAVSLKGRCSAIGTQLRHSLRHNEDLSRAVDGLQLSKADVEGLLKESRSTVGQLRSELANLQVDHDSNVRSLSERDMYMEALKKDYSRLNAEYTSLQHQKTDTETKSRTEISSLVAERKSLIETHQKELAEKQANALKELDNVRNQAKKDNSMLKDAIVCMSKETWNIQNESLSVAKQLKQVKDLVKSVNAENVALEANMAQKDKDYDELEKELASATSVVGSADSSAVLSDLKQQLQDRERRISALEAEKENRDPQESKQSKENVAIYSSEIAKLNNTNQELMKRFEEKSHQLNLTNAEHQKETSTLKSKLLSTEEAAKQSRFFLEATIQQLRSDLYRSNEEAVDLKSKLTLIDTANKALKKEIHQLKLDKHTVAQMPRLDSEKGNENLRKLTKDLAEKDRLLLIAAEEFRKVKITCQSTTSALEEAKEAHVIAEQQLREKHSFDIQELVEKISSLHQKDETLQMRAQSRQKELEEVQRRNQMLMQDLEGHKKSETMLQDQICELNNSFSVLESEKNGLEQKLSELGSNAKSEISGLKGQIKNLNESLSNVTSDKCQLEQKLEETMANSQTDIIALKNSVSKLNNVLNSTRDTLSNKLAEQEELKNEFSMAKKGVKLLGSVLKEARLQSANNSDKLATSSQELDRREATIALLENQCASGALLRSEFKQCRLAAVDLQATIASLQQENAAKDQHIKEESFKYNQLTKQVDVLHAELGSEAGSSWDVKANIESMMNSIKGLRMEKAALEAELHDTEERFSNESTKLKSTVQELRGMIERSAVECQKNEALAKSHEETLAKLQSELNEGQETLDGKVKSQAAVIEALKSDILVKGEEIWRLIGNSQALATEMSEKEENSSAQIRDLTEKVSELQTQNGQLGITLHTQKESNDQIIAELKSTIQTISMEYDEEKEKATSLKSAVESLKDDLDTTQAHADITNAELDRIRTQSDVEIKAKLEAINLLKAQISAAESKIEGKEVEVKEVLNKLEDANTELAGNINALKGVNETLQADKQKLEVTLRDMEASFAAETKNNEELLKEWSATREVVSKELMEEKFKADLQARRISELESALCSANARLESLEKERGANEERLEKETSGFSLQLDSILNERDSLRAELENARAEMYNLTDNIIPSLNNQLKENDIEISQMHSSLRVKDEQIQAQESAKTIADDQLAQAIAELQGSAQSATEKQESLMKEMNQMKELCETLQRHTIPSLESELGTARDENIRLSNQLIEQTAQLHQRFNSDRDVAKAKFDEVEQLLKDEVNKLSESLSNITAERDLLVVDLTGVKTECENFSTQVVPSLKSQLVEADTELERFNKMFDLKEGEMQALKNEFEIMETKAQSELETAKASIGSLNERIVQLSQENERLQKDVIAGLHKQLSDAKSDMDNYRMSISSKESELSEFKKIHEMSDNESKVRIEGLQTMAAEVRKNQEESENEFRKELSMLQEQLESVQIESQQLSQGLNASQTETADLTESLNARIKSGQDEIARLESVLATKEAEIQEMQWKADKVEELKMELSKTQDELASRMSQVEQLEKNKATNNDQIESNRKTLNDAVNNLNSLRSDFNKAEQEKKLLAEKLDRVTSAHEVVSRAKEDAETRVEEGQDMIKNMQQRMETLQQELREKEGLEKTQRERSEVLKSSLESLEKKNDSIVKELESTRADLQKEAAAHMDVLSNLREELSTARQERDEERTSSESRKSALEALEAKFDRLKADMKAQVDDEKKQVEKLEGGRNKLIGQIESLEAAEETSSKKLVDLNTSLGIMTSRCEAVEARLKKQRKEFETEERKLESHVEKLQDEIRENGKAQKKSAKALVDSERSLREITSRCESAEAKLKKLHKEEDRTQKKLQTEIEHLQEKLDEANSKLEESEKCLASTMKKQVTLTRDTIPGLRATVTQLKTEVKSLTKNMTAKEAEISKLNERLERVAELESELADSQNALEKAKASAKTSGKGDKTEVEKLQKKVKNLEEEIDEMRPVINDYEALNKKYLSCMRKLNVAKQKNKSFEAKLKDSAADGENQATDTPTSKGADRTLRSKRRATLSGVALGEQPVAKKAKGQQQQNDDSTMTLRSRNPMSNVSESFMNTRGRR